jgi:hypothetical protein
VIKIVGSGMAGLLAANLLRRMQPVVHEAQGVLPNNHSALLRFRSDVCARATGIPFKKVLVHKAVCTDGKLLDRTNLAINNQYSVKVTGKVLDRSIINLEPGERFIAPPDFISQMSHSVQIVYGSPFTAGELSARTPDSTPLISTMPMPALMDMAEWKAPPIFLSRPVWAVTGRIDDCDVYQTVYYPQETFPAYRASITGNLLTVETMTEPKAHPHSLVNEVLHTLGINQGCYDIEVKCQKYGKLTPLSDPSIARRFVLYMTDRYRVYSVGRFALWRQLLLDDVCHDIGVVEKLVDNREGYSGQLIKAKI